MKKYNLILMKPSLPTLNSTKAPPKSPGRAFSMYTDTFSIRVYLVSIPLSRICFLTASMGTSSLWKIPAAKAASTSVFSKPLKSAPPFRHRMRNDWNGVEIDSGYIESDFLSKNYKWWQDIYIPNYLLMLFLPKL